MLCRHSSLLHSSPLYFLFCSVPRVLSESGSAGVTERVFGPRLGQGVGIWCGDSRTATLLEALSSPESPPSSAGQECFLPIILTLSHAVGELLPLRCAGRVLAVGDPQLRLGPDSGKQPHPTPPPLAWPFSQSKLRRGRSLRKALAAVPGTAVSQPEICADEAEPSQKSRSSSFPSRQ